ncbi:MULTISPECIES: helix-turn-helix domain-containing protein [Sphingobium]|uniref:helix-turn-helix domain-containing protein n=1 Tax=Sphingobium TaxID=165695 RepID=UPI00159C7DE8|nr:helix-turn-helix domain-containing protein [Sphingobium sp. 15-1]
MHAATANQSAPAEFPRNWFERTATAPGPQLQAVEVQPNKALNGANENQHMVSSHYADNFFGTDFARRLMMSAGLCERSDMPPAFISCADFWMMCIASINEANDENHGCTGQPMPKSSWAMVYSSVNQMETVGAGLKRFAELASIIPNGLTISFSYSANVAKLSYEAGPGVVDVERAERYAELMALVFHCVLLWGADHPIRPRCVKLSEHLADADGSMASLLSPNRCRIGGGTTVSYHRDDMALPLGVRRYKSWASHETSMFLELVGKSSPAEEAPEEADTTVAGKLRQMLNHRNLSQEQAARKLGMSVATLQRRLAATGDSFREISREIRALKLRSLLATDSNLDDIAVELGFAERRSLWRACQEWLGMSPACYRRMLRAR